MRKALLIVCAVVCSVFYVSAQQYQDVVYLKNGSVVRGIILEQIPGKTIKIATDNGSQLIFNLQEVEKMTKELPVQQPQQPVYQPQYQQYQQSQQPVYQQPQQPVYQQPQTVARVKAPKVKKVIDWTPKYKGEINVGYAIAGSKFDFDYEAAYTEEGESDSESGNCGKYKTVFSRPLFETIHGVQVGPYLFFGAGIGLQYYCGKLKDFQELADYAAEIEDKDKVSERWNAVMLPIFADIKFMYPVSDKFTPFVNLGLGGTIGCYSSVNCNYSEDAFEYSSKVRGGFYCDLGVGFRYKALNFGLGFQHQAVKLVSNMSGEDYDYDYGEYSYSTETKISTKINSFYVKIGVNF